MGLQRVEHDRATFTDFSVKRGATFAVCLLLCLTEFSKGQNHLLFTYQICILKYLFLFLVGLDVFSCMQAFSSCSEPGLPSS